MFDIPPEKQRQIRELLKMGATSSTLAVISCLHPLSVYYFIKFIELTEGNIETTLIRVRGKRGRPAIMYKLREENKKPYKRDNGSRDSNPKQQR